MPFRKPGCGSDTSGVENLRGWLTTVVARVCLDMLRSRKSRHEGPLEAHVPEPIVSRAEAFYQNADKRDQGQRMPAYTDALEQIYINYPDDPEAEIFYGYAVAALAPPTDKTYACQLKGAAILERALERNPNHPGAAHYLIHAYDHTPLRDNRAFSATRAANPVTHFRSAGTVAGIDRSQSRGGEGRRSLLEIPRPGLPAP